MNDRDHQADPFRVTCVEPATRIARRGDPTAAPIYYFPYRDALVIDGVECSPEMIASLAMRASLGWAGPFWIRRNGDTIEFSETEPEAS
jgi:hypothetical protein